MPLEPTPEMIREFVPVPQVSKWLGEAKIQGLHFGAEYVARQAFRSGYAAGADAELEACCSFFDLDGQPRVANSLRAARRPKPPSLKQQAIKSLDLLMGDLACLYHDEDHSFHSDRIRRAIESLPDD
jgi:hypothetical protein